MKKRWWFLLLLGVASVVVSVLYFFGDRIGFDRSDDGMFI